MAGRRCFSDKIVESDAFYKLPETAQTLYFHLNMNADDDGFLNNAESVAKKIRGGKNALQKLVEERFLLKFGDIYVVKHWRISNSLKNDRIKPLTYAGIAGEIWVKPNRAYTDHPGEGYVTLQEKKTGIQLESSWNPVGIQLESQPNRTEQNGNRTEWEQNRTEMRRVFSELWNDYPELRRGQEKQAFSFWLTEVQTTQNAELALRNLAFWKFSEQWAKEGGRYIPVLCNWLDRGYWREAPADAKQKCGIWGCGELGPAELEAIQKISNKQKSPDSNDPV